MKKWKREPYEEDDENQDVVEKIAVPMEKMGHVVGKHFGNRDRLEKIYRIRVSIPERWLIPFN